MSLTAPDPAANGSLPPPPRTPGRSTAPSRAAWERELLARLQHIAGSRTFRSLADLTGCHPETVRRYLRNGRPSAYFVATLCRALGASPEWVMTGIEPGSSPGSRAVESKPRPRASVPGGNGKAAGSRPALPPR